jgi:hypothetical protein
MSQASTRKITSQKTGSILKGIQNTVANAIASPKRESRKISFHFISVVFEGGCLIDLTNIVLYQGIWYLAIDN